MLLILRSVVLSQEVIFAVLLGLIDGNGNDRKYRLSYGEKI